MLRGATLVLTLMGLSVTNTDSSSFYPAAGDLAPVDGQIEIPVAWQYRKDVSSPITRFRRNIEITGNEIAAESSNVGLSIEDPKCREELRRLCGDPDNNQDHLFVLECVQTFKVPTFFIIILLPFSRQ